MEMMINVHFKKEKVGLYATHDIVFLIKLKIPSQILYENSTT